MLFRVEDIFFQYASPVVDNIQLVEFEPGICLTDTDNDMIPNSLDLDSDNDGCPDFIEGGGSFTTADGGTLSDGNGGTVTTNLGNTVGTTAGVDNGVPTVAGTGQI